MPEQPCAFHPDRMTGVSCSRCGRPICPDDMYPAPVGQHCPICAGKMREGPLGRTGYQVRTRAERMPAARFFAGAGVRVVLLSSMLLIGINLFIRVETVGFDLRAPIGGMNKGFVSACGLDGTPR